MRIVMENESDRRRAIKAIESANLPATFNVTKGKPRSHEQNKLMRKWCNELAEQGDMTAEEYRGYNKAWFGLPILIRDDEGFAEKYDRIIKPLPYEEKLELMQVPFDFPVTRLMSTKQEKEMLDAMYTHWTGKGYHLTEPG